ncbi:MAG: lipoprotein signal peptidase [Thalassobius sp.]|nr:lipoprotein signal peptidase [Thalassovita sp.]
MKYSKYFLISFLVILLDQTVKLLVYFNMELGEFGEISVFGDWFKLHYILNEGMAFGFTFGSNYGKLILTFFRLIAMLVIGWYLVVFTRKKLPPLFLISIALILGGAVGNVVDSIFYGVFLEHAPEVSNAPFLYPWFHGKVIDMFYFDFWQGYLPDWVPLIGGEYFAFWPIFNIADGAIFFGVTIILAFQKKFFTFPDENLAEIEVPAEKSIKE